MFDKLDLGNLDLNALMGDVQKKAQEMQEEAASKTYTAKSGGGMVSATVNGNMELVDLEIDDSLLDDKDSMQILLISAINEAMKMLSQDKQNSAMQMFGGLNPFGAQNS
jgi:DNA-binding YbaB/EbfC family protein